MSNITRREFLTTASLATGTVVFGHHLATAGAENPTTRVGLVVYTLEYPGFILSYECTLFNAFGTGTKWDVIHFNHGLHDLSYRFADDRDMDAQGNYATPHNGGHQNVAPEEYRQNLHKIVARLRQTGAKLIFATTTPVPECEAGKYVKDSELPYNEVARKVMAEEGIVVNDLWDAVKPQLEKLQIPRNVHFHAAGSAALAKQVAQSIRAALPRQLPESRK